MPKTQEEHVQDEDLNGLRAIGPVILSAFRTPNTVPNVVRDIGLPIGRAYERIRQLVDLGFLVMLEKVQMSSGKRMAVYIASVRYEENPEVLKVRNALHEDPYALQKILREEPE